MTTTEYLELYAAARAGVNDPRLLSLYIKAAVQEAGVIEVPDTPVFRRAVNILCQDPAFVYVDASLARKFREALKLKKLFRQLQNPTTGRGDPIRALERFRRHAKKLDKKTRKIVARMIAGTAALVKKAAETNNARYLTAFLQLFVRALKQAAALKNIVVMLKEHMARREPKKAEAGLRDWFKVDSLKRAISLAMEAVQEARRSTNKLVKKLGPAILRILVDIFYTILILGITMAYTYLYEQFQPVIRRAKEVAEGMKDVLREVIEEEEGEGPEPEFTGGGYLVEGILKKLYREKTGRKEWALVSRKNPKKVLKWFGPRKPSKERVLKEERRIQYFKHAKGAVS